MNHFFVTHKHSWNFKYKWVCPNNYLWNLIYSYSIQCWFISSAYNEYAYNVDIKLIPFEIYLIHRVILIYIYNFRKILIICTYNMYSLSYCYIYNKRKKGHLSKKDREQQAERVAMDMLTTLTSNSYHSKYVWFISLLTHLDS